MRLLPARSGVQIPSGVLRKIFDFSKKYDIIIINEQERKGIEKWQKVGKQYIQIQAQEIN